MGNRSVFGLFPDQPGKKVRASSITDENGLVVYIQAGSISDPDTTAIANVKAGGIAPNPSTDSAVVVTIRDSITQTAPAALASICTSVASSNITFKSSPGSLFTLACAPTTVSGYIMLFDASSVPSDGTVTPKWVQPVFANGGASWSWWNPISFSTGIVAVFSSTGPFVKTASATAFISGQVQ